MGVSVAPATSRPAIANASGGFRLSTIELGIRIVAPRSLVVFIDDVHRAQLKRTRMGFIDLRRFDKLPATLASSTSRPKQSPSRTRRRSAGSTRTGIDAHMPIPRNSGRLPCSSTARRFASIAGLGALKTVITSRARITRAPTADDRNETHDSGDTDSFVGEDDAISCAKARAIEWCDESWD